jgi:hypothetical protein
VARDGATLYTNKQIAINNLKEVGSIYVEKFVGAAFSLVPLVGWAPWELFFQDNTNVTNNSHVISYGSLSTICFTYVKLAGKDDSWQKLSFVSNTFSIAAGHTLRGIKNGLPFTHSKDTNNTVYAENYSSGYKAVDSYLNTSTQRSSFARYFRFYNHDKTANITAYVLNPSVPTQITIN